MDTGKLLDTIGALTSRLKNYAAKLPPIVHLSSAPSGVRPTPESVEEYEDLVARFRTQTAGTPYKTLYESLLDSLEAFESGRLLGATQPLLSLLDQVERMKTDHEIEVRRIDEKRMQEYRAALRAILPGNTPELDETTRPG